MQNQLCIKYRFITCPEHKSTGVFKIAADPSMIDDGAATMDLTRDFKWSFFGDCLLSFNYNHAIYT